MITIRVGSTADSEQVNAFYVTHGSSAPVAASEQWVLAEDGE